MTTSGAWLKAFHGDLRERTCRAGRTFSIFAVGAVSAIALQSAFILQFGLFARWAFVGLLPVLAFLVASLSDGYRRGGWVLPLHAAALFGFICMACGFVYTVFSMQDSHQEPQGLAAISLFTALFIVFFFAAGNRRILLAIVGVPMALLTLILLLHGDASRNELGNLVLAWVFALATGIASLIQARKLRDDYEQRANAAGQPPVDRELAALRADNDRLRASVVELRRELIALQNEEAELERRAAVDELTGVYNRRAGIELLRQSIHLAERNAQPLTTCFIDVDDLKIINDNFGHAEGDALIRHVVNVLKRHLRKSDAVCRFGGDEFIVVLPNCTKGSAEYIVERMDEELAEETPGNKRYRPRVSAGFSEFSDHHTVTLEALLEEADRDMYRTKQQRKQGR